MSRSDHPYGLSKRGRALVERARAVRSVTFEGLCNPIELVTWRLPDERVLEEYVQAEPWSSGPHWFLSLRVPGQEVGFPEIDWTDQEIANQMGESYGDADPEPTPSQLAWWQELVDDGSLDPESGREASTTLHWSDEQMVLRALASGQLRPRHQSGDGEVDSQQTAASRAVSSKSHPTDP